MLLDLDFVEIGLKLPIFIEVGNFLLKSFKKFLMTFLTCSITRNLTSSSIAFRKSLGIYSKTFSSYSFSFGFVLFTLFIEEKFRFSWSNEKYIVFSISLLKEELDDPMLFIFLYSINKFYVTSNLMFLSFCSNELQFKILDILEFVKNAWKYEIWDNFRAKIKLAILTAISHQI